MSSTRDPFPSTSFEVLSKEESNHWWFRSRNEILLWVLRSKIRPFNSFFEIGCGTGYVLSGVYKAFPSTRLFGAEYFEEGLEFARKRIPAASFKQLDARCLSEVDHYDVIGAFDVIEHIEEDEKVLKNVGRALQPGGALVITVPQHRWLWSVTDEQACHVRRYTRAELIEKVKRAGLQIQYVTSFVSFLVPLMWLSRRVASNDKKHDPMSEFRIPGWLNRILELVMKAELALLKAGIRFPLGGSLLLVAKKDDAVH